jgi:molybdopterin synthase catalytic subunit
VADRIWLVDRPIDVPALIAAVAGPDAGALSLFLGTVRNRNDGRPVTGIEYEAYPDMARREMAAIATEAERAFDGVRIAVVHRTGFLRVGDVSVAIAAAHPHRAAALDASREVIEALKRRVPIWKREHYLDGERRWVDPTADVPA